MAIEFDNPVTAGTTLVRSAINSPNFRHAAAGWSVNQDGSAEFNNLTVRNGVAVSGTSLYYNGTPTTGNLVMSISSAAGTDAYGNAYVSGLAVYNAGTVEYQVDLSGDLQIGPAAGGHFQFTPGGNGVMNAYDSSGNLVLNLDSNSGILTLLNNASLQFVQINLHTTGVPGGIIFGTYSGGTNMPTLAQQQSAAQLALSANAGALVAVAPNYSTAPKPAQFKLANGQNNTGTGQAGVPLASLFADPSSNASDCDLAISGSIVKTDRTNNNQPFTWQAPALGSGWASGAQSGTYQPLQFRRDVEDNLYLVGVIHSTSSTPAATIFTLPSGGGYRPSTNQRVPCTANSGGNYSAHSLIITAGTGAVSVDPGFTVSGADLYIDALVPLGHIS